MSISNVELQVKRIYCISRASALPLQIEDAARPESDFEKDPTLVRVGQDVRLDNRVLDLRTPANQAIPQLYKQMALMTDLPKVFEIAPVFRAEQSFTHRHMTEFMGFDMEMHFNEHYSECLDQLNRALRIGI